MEKHPDRLIGFAYLDPWQYTAEEELCRCVTEYGMKGLKLNPTKQAFAIDRHSLLDPIFEICAAKRLPIVVHGTSDLFCMPSKFATMARAFPNVTLIMAHMGLPDAFDSAMRVVGRYANLFVDTSGVSPRAVREALEAVGPEKILMATEVPWSRFEASIRAVEQATADPAERELIMGGNILRLLGVL